MGSQGLEQVNDQNEMAMNLAVKEKQYALATQIVLKMSYSSIARANTPGTAEAAMKSASEGSDEWKGNGARHVDSLPC